MFPREPLTYFNDGEVRGTFLGMLKKGSDFFGKTNSEVVIFWGIKYESLSDPPPSH